MRRIQTTNVNVHVNDHLDRTNVVVTLYARLRRGCLSLRGACLALAKQCECWLGSQAMFAAPAGSPSWGGHRPSGGPGRSTRS
jgi:hypothetical protein